MPPNQGQPATGSGSPDGEKSNKTLRETVKECLLSVVTDTAASAAARASAGRTLLEYFDDGEHARGSGGKRGAELTLEELDAEIASHTLPSR